MASKHLVLLPGLDGTGELFADFVVALGESWTATILSYPTDKFLSYADLRPLITAAVPKPDRFVLVAESFSTPLALWYAANAPQNLTAVVICAGFVRTPARGWSEAVKAIAKPWLLGLEPPRFFLEHFLLGQNGPPGLLQKVRQTLRSVSPQVLSGRVHEVLNCDAREDLSRIKVPMLYLEATNDRLLPSGCKEEFSRLKPDLLIDSIPGPHLLLQREPHKAAAVMTDFINSLPLGPV